MKERRKNQRFQNYEQLSVRFEDDFIEGTECSDISEGGMCIVFNDIIRNDDRYGTVMLARKNKDDVIIFESRFVRLWDNLVYVDKKDTRMGVRFIGMDQKNRENLLRILELNNSHLCSN